MRTSALLLSLIIVAAPAIDVLAQDAPAKDAKAEPAKKAEERKPVKDPSSSISKGIKEALGGMFSDSGAARLQSRSALDTAITDWAEAAKDDPLRATAWWKKA
ncbi:MAG: hypothetical protein ACYTDX_06465, partial [Planctomycetota bacterium]